MNSAVNEACIDDVMNCIFMGPFGSNIKVDCFVNEGVPVLNGSNLVGFTVNDSNLRFVTREKADSLGNAVAVREDVVVTHRGTLGQIAYIPTTSKYSEYVISQSQFLCRCGESILPEYLVFFFHTPLGQWKLLSNKTQTGVPALGRPTSTFRKLTIPLPDLETQRKIVTLINSIQAKINLNNRINDYLAAFADTLFKREFGKHKESATLSDFTEITMGQSPTGTSYNENGEGAVFYQGRGEFGWRFPTQRLFTTEPKRMAKTGDILMSVRAPVGDLNVAYEDCCIGRGLAAISSEHPSFCLYLLRSLRNKLDAYNGEGTVFGSINGKALKTLGITLPTNDTIMEFEKKVMPIDALIRINEEESRSLAELRDELLPKLMSGVIDVSKVDILQSIETQEEVG